MSPRTILKRLPSYVLLVAFMMSLWSGQYFSYTRSRGPVIAAGRVDPFDEHGVRAYLTFNEHLIAGNPASVAIFVLFAGWILKDTRRERDHKDSR